MSLSVQSARSTAVRVWHNPEARRFFAFHHGFPRPRRRDRPVRQHHGAPGRVHRLARSPASPLFLALGVGFWGLSLVNARYKREDPAPQTTEFSPHRSA